MFLEMIYCTVDIDYIFEVKKNLLIPSIKIEKLIAMINIYFILNSLLKKYNFLLNIIE